MIEIRISGPTPDDLSIYIERFDLVKPVMVQWAKKLLKDEGYAVQIPRKWENIKEFCERIGIHRQTFTRCLSYVGCPDVHLEWGKNRKNIVAIASNDLFDAFCIAGKGTTRKRQA